MRMILQVIVQAKAGAEVASGKALTVDGHTESARS